MNEKSGYRNGQLIYPISVLDTKPQEGGGGGSQPGPNTVGTEQIIDGAVEMEDLNDSVKQKIQKVYDEDDETMHMDFDEADVNNSQQEVEQPGGGFNNPMTEEEGD